MAMALTLLGAYLGWCALLYGLQDALFFPGRSLPGRTPEPPRGVSSRFVEHPDGVRTEYWLSEGPSAAPLVVFLHGNGHRIEHELPILEFLHRRGYRVLLPEYRGYGSSEGKPSERAIVDDLGRIIDRLLADGTTTPEQLAYWGRSLGAAFAAQLAAKRPPRGLILQTPLARADQLAWSYGVPPLLVKHPLRTDEALLAARGAATLILEHTRDTIAPAKDARRLHALRPDAELVRIDAGHNDSGSPTEQAKEDAAIVAFLQRSFGE